MTLVTRNQTVAVHSALFAGLGYVSCSIAQGAVNLVNASKIGFFTREPALFKGITAADPVQMGIMCALFVAVDSIFKEMMEQQLGKNQADLSGMKIVRIVFSMASTASFFTILGLSPSVSVAAVIMGVALQLFASLHSNATIYQNGIYQFVKT